MRFARNLVLAAISGWTINLAFPTLGWWPAAPLGLAILWWSLEGVKPWPAAVLGLASGLGFFLPHIFWARAAVGVVPWVALSVLESLAIALVAAVWAHVRMSKMLRRAVPLEPVVFAALWVAGEQLRSVIPWGGFPWGRLAFSQVDMPVARFAWLGGAVLVSFVVALVGGCLGLAFEAMRGKRVLLPAVAGAAGSVLLLAGIFIPVDARAESGTLRLGVAQGDVPNRGLDSFSERRLVTVNHAEASYAILQEVPWPLDLMVWPENAADLDPRTDTATSLILTDVAVAAGAPVLVGSIENVEGGRLNISILWSPEGTVLDTYVKQHPAPFAEYIPMRGFARLFSDAVDRVNRDMLPGTEVGVVTLPSARLGRDVVVGDVICFEVAYDGIVRDSVRAGAELLVVQTNNASFGLTAESEQQLAMTRLRAIETGRSTVQSSTVGVSAIVAPDGRVLAKTGLFTQEWMSAEVPLRTSLTPASRHGSLVDLAFLVLPWLWLGIRWLLSLRGRWEWK